MAYTTSDIDELDDVQHTRIRPQVNLGEHVYDTALREIVDNAIEEVSRPANGGTSVIIRLHADGSVTVADDGRGLPVDTDPRTGKNGVVKTLGTARSGGKFDAHADAEATGAGLNGIGAAAAVFLSRRCDVSVLRDGKLYCAQFGGGYPGVFSGDAFDPEARFTRDDAVKLRGTRSPSGPSHGTAVRILFDFTVVPDDSLDIAEVLLRAHAAARMSPGVALTVVDEGWPLGQVPQELLTPFTGPYGTAELLSFMSAATGAPNPAPDGCATLDGRGTYTTGRGATPFTWSMTAGPSPSLSGRAHGFCNTVRTVGGGTHVNAAVAGVSGALADVASRMRSLPLNKGESAPEAQDFAEVCSAAVSLRAPDVSWDGQSKTKVTSRSLSSPLETDVRRATTAWAAAPANSAALLGWAKAALEAARTRRSVDSARSRARAASKARGLGTNMALPDKLLPCRDTGRGSGAELLLCEGDSAKATIKSARDATVQAVYAMRGKTLNPWDMTASAARANAEFSDIEAILGCGVGAKTDPEQCRYDRIIFTADADPDGMGINSQLAMIFARFYRPLIKSGMVYVAVPPLFVVEWAGHRMYCVTEGDKEELLAELRTALDPESDAGTAKAAVDAVTSAVSEHRRAELRADLSRRRAGRVKVSRCKGLGEMEADDFHTTVLDPATRTLIQLTIPDGDDAALDALGDELFGPSARYAAARREWMAHGDVDPEVQE